MTITKEPNEQSGYRRIEFELRCWRGHRWTVQGFEEFGGGFLDNEDEAQCAECGAWEGDEPPEPPEED